MGISICRLPVQRSFQGTLTSGIDIWLMNIVFPIFGKALYLFKLQKSKCHKTGKYQ
jgi:hypothetical protein